MRKITFSAVDKWTKLAKKPLDNERLEQFQEQHFGESKSAHYRFFFYLVAQMKPKIALELGVDHGHTVVHMAAANPDTLVLGFDKDMFCADKRHREYSNCRIHYIDSLDGEDLIQHFVSKHGKIGVVFQDSSHHYEESVKEFEIYSKYLDKNAIWCCDDITPNFHDPDFDPPGKGMVEYFGGLSGRKKIYDDLHYGTKIGVVLMP